MKNKSYLQKLLNLPDGKAIELELAISTLVLVIGIILRALAINELGYGFLSTAMLLYADPFIQLFSQWMPNKVLAIFIAVFVLLIVYVLLIFGLGLIFR
ncbi:hypothetical protein [Lacticaseibacillus saniviri]|uniref:hypothetical protein n=1 Tax=Lacticaseibacillus saniviri TaxID=931533 RepID=UPI0006D09B8A|nr:hypothetical protein [Lacticaseibacillus saniviri]MCG4281870.1 hypothetical protein [Lacticaseibacillus saniviri]